MTLITLITPAILSFNAAARHGASASALGAPLSGGAIRRRVCLSRLAGAPDEKKNRHTIQQDRTGPQSPRFASLGLERRRRHHHHHLYCLFSPNALSITILCLSLLPSLFSPFPSGTAGRQKSNPPAMLVLLSVFLLAVFLPLVSVHSKPGARLWARIQLALGLAPPEARSRPSASPRPYSPSSAEKPAAGTTAARPPRALEEFLPSPAPDASLTPDQLDMHDVRDHIYANKAIRYPYHQTMAHQAMASESWIEPDKFYRSDLEYKKKLIDMQVRQIRSGPGLLLVLSCPSFFRAVPCYAVLCCTPTVQLLRRPRPGCWRNHMAFRGVPRYFLFTHTYTHLQRMGEHGADRH